MSIPFSSFPSILHVCATCTHLAQGNHSIHVQCTTCTHLEAFLSTLPFLFLLPSLPLPFLQISSLIHPSSSPSSLLSPILPPPSDLEYGLPVQVRDQALGVKDNLPQSDVGREYYLQNMEKEVSHVMVAMVTIVLSHGIVSTAKAV